MPWPVALPFNELLVSHSSLSTFESCARKFEFRKLNIGADSPSGLPAEIGQCLHIAYQTWLATQNEDKALISLMLSYPINLCSDPSHNYSIEACMSTLRALMQTEIMMDYEIAEINCIDGVKRDAIEVPFKINLTNMFLDEAKTIPIAYIGYIDLIVFDFITQKFCMVDLKTHRQNIPDLSIKYAFDAQCIPYALVLEQILGQSIEALNVKYLTAYIDLLAPKIQDYPFSKSKQDVQDWARTIYLNIQQIKLFYSMGWFPRTMRGDVCFSYNSPCWFKDICHNRNLQNIHNYFLAERAQTKQKEFKPWIEIELELAA